MCPPVAWAPAPTSSPHYRDRWPARAHARTSSASCARRHSRRAPHSGTNLVPLRANPWRAESGTRRYEAGLAQRTRRQTARWDGKMREWQKLAWGRGREHRQGQQTIAAGQIAPNFAERATA
eukprot:scaffold224914_cov27-Tisochrysis_lutea.AAC.2